MAINTSITPCVQRLKPVRGSFVLNTAGIPCDLHKCHLIHGMKTRTCLPHTIYPDIRDKSTDDFHPKIPPRTTHPPPSPFKTLCWKLFFYWFTGVQGRRKPPEDRKPPGVYTATQTSWARSSEQMNLRLPKFSCTETCIQVCSFSHTPRLGALPNPLQTLLQPCCIPTGGLAHEKKKPKQKTTSIPKGCFLKLFSAPLTGRRLLLFTSV